MPMNPAAADAAPPSRKPIAVQMPKPGTPKNPGIARAMAITTATIADRAVLPPHVRHRALLDRSGDLLHLLVAGRQLVDPHDEEAGIGGGDYAGEPCQGTAAEWAFLLQIRRCGRGAGPHPPQDAHILSEWSAVHEESALADETSPPCGWHGSANGPKPARSPRRDTGRAPTRRSPASRRAPARSPRHRACARPRLPAPPPRARPRSSRRDARRALPRR